jgi:2-polyprenyl-3-methyl-5-hydroxy-6-metoxy-1,4-benzoquinol methylase
MKNKYQLDYSSQHQAAMYDANVREKKAHTIVAVLNKHYSDKLKQLSVLDIGSSTGIIANALSCRFYSVIGVDIDEPAVKYASNRFKKRTVNFFVSDSMNLPFNSNHFDVVICAQVYEHVPDPVQMINEIHRVLKPGGVCYFAAGNRLRLIEPHYKLPFLSIIPRKLAHKYMQLTGKGESYYEKHFSYWGLKQLTKRFERFDYTQKIIENPLLYHAEYMLPVGSTKQMIADVIIKSFPWLSPGYIWLLKKIVSKNTP